MISLSDFLPGVRMDAPGCPEAVMLKAIRETVRDLCGTGLWSEDLYKISLAAGYPEYDIELPPGAVLMTILSAKYNGSPVSVYTSNEMDDKVSNWREATGTGISAVIVDDDDVVRVYPIPTAAEADCLLLHASLKPSVTATTCGDVFADWSETVEHGALARLKAQTGKPWTDKENVMYHNGEYSKGRAKAKARVLRGRSDKPLRAESRSFV